jgi:integrase/recombinase XerD
LQNEKRISESTAKMYAWIAGKALDKIGKAIPSEEDIEGYREHMRAKGLASSSQSNTLMALQHWLGFNSIEVSLKKPKRNHRSPTYLTESEANRLIEACETPKEKAVVTVLLYSGLRASELCALDRTDVDFEENLIHVRKGKGNTDEYVAVDRKALECVRNLLNQREDTEPFLFTNRRGNRYTRKGIEGIVGKVAERARIEKHVTPHVLRHTLATNLLKNGCSLPLIQQQLRHKQTETTMVYLHSDKEMLKEAYERHKPRF